MSSCQDGPGCAGEFFRCIDEECFAFNEALPSSSRDMFSVRLRSDEGPSVFRRGVFVGDQEVLSFRFCLLIWKNSPMQLCRADMRGRWKFEDDEGSDAKV